MTAVPVSDLSPSRIWESLHTLCLEPVFRVIVYDYYCHPPGVESSP